MRPFVGAILKDDICAIFFLFLFTQKKGTVVFFFGLFGHLGGFRAPNVEKDRIFTKKGLK